MSVPTHNKNTLSLVSWNINGLRSAHRKGFLDWIRATQHDIICLQETRAQQDQLADELRCPQGYNAYWFPARLPGYSGTGFLCRRAPEELSFGLGVCVDDEGRTIIARFGRLTIVNCYVPNGNRGPDRLAFKLRFYQQLYERCMALRRSGQTVILCGDFNTAHNEIDLAHPAPNRNKSGFLAQERAWFDRMVGGGFVDTFRQHHPDAKERYTWWANTFDARVRNVGWRFDYVFVTQNAAKRVLDAFILPQVHYSDHCPIGIRFKGWR